MPCYHRRMRRFIPRRVRPVASEPARIVPLVECVRAHGISWYHFPDFRAVDVPWLADFHDFHALTLEDVVSRTQRPKIDRYDDYAFAVFHFPTWDHGKQRLSVSEIDVFIGEDWVITAVEAPREISALSALFVRLADDPAAQQQLMGQGAQRLFYHIVDTMFDRSFPQLNLIGDKLDSIDERLFDHDPEVLRDIQAVKREIITFRKIMRPQQTLLDDVERSLARTFGEDDGELARYVADLRDAVGRIWDVLENYKEVAVSLDETLEQQTQNRVNDTLRVLTSITVIVLPLTLVASVFGMNVEVPGQGSITAFWLIMGILVALLVGMVVAFRRRNLL